MTGDKGRHSLTRSRSECANWRCAHAAGLPRARVEHGELMTSVEIRDYRGDFEDLAELSRQVWLTEYRGRVWFPIAEADFMRWKLAPETGARCPSAYAGTRLVGSVFSIPHSLRVGDAVYPMAYLSNFTVIPEHRRLALPLIERARRQNEERGLAFGIGMVLDDPTTVSCRFWMKYAETFPQHFQFIERAGYWGKFLGPHAVARAGIQAWERFASRALGPLMRFTPYGLDPNVRPYRAGDLARCAQMLDKATANFDWAMVWQPEQLATQLGNSAETFVFERDGSVKGMVNAQCFLLHGREPIRAAMINLWAEDGLTGTERARLLSHLCTELRENQVHAVVAPRCAMMPGAAFVANLFFPSTQHFHIGVFPTQRMKTLPRPKSWSLMMM
jgi:hypothetical protein